LAGRANAPWSPPSPSRASYRPLHAHTGSSLACFHLARVMKHSVARLKRSAEGREVAAGDQRYQVETFARLALWRPKAGRNGGNFACRLWRCQRFCGFARTVWRIACPPTRESLTDAWFLRTMSEPSINWLRNCCDTAHAFPPASQEASVRSPNP
jgi:hypothetical protein